MLVLKFLAFFLPVYATEKARQFQNKHTSPSRRSSIVLALEATNIFFVKIFF